MFQILNKEELSSELLWKISREGVLEFGAPDLPQLARSTGGFASLLPLADSRSTTVSFCRTG